MFSVYVYIPAVIHAHRSKEFRESRWCCAAQADAREWWLCLSLWVLPLVMTGITRKGWTCRRDGICQVSPSRGLGARTCDLTRPGTRPARPGGGSGSRTASEQRSQEQIRMPGSSQPSCWQRGQGARLWNPAVCVREKVTGPARTAVCMLPTPPMCHGIPGWLFVALPVRAVLSS